MAEIKIISKEKQMPKLVRVAAYARVSSDKDAMLHSLSSQVSYFSKMIQSHDSWKYVGVYSDEGMTVLDNCMGSGSTGVACINTNRNFIGIELDDNYFQIADNRLREATELKNESNSTII